MNANNCPSANYMFLVGIALLVFGGVAMASPVFAGTSVVIVIGIVLTIVGIVHLVQGVREESFSSKLLSIILGAITVIGGLAVFAHPLFGLSVLTLVIAIYFIVEGIWKIIASFSLRKAAGWLYILGSGAIDLLLGVLIWNDWPLSGLVAVGILVGVDFIVTGVAMIVLSSGIKRLLAKLAA